MCELLAATSQNRIFMNDYLRTFYSHSEEHRNGWGLALLDRVPVFIEKEPVKASDSPRLEEILQSDIKTSMCIAHIRMATIGELNNKNTHPFCKRDDSGRMWTLAHNGTIFESDILAPYQYIQNGSTDSERILLYIVDEMNRHISNHEDLSDVNNRIGIIDEVIKSIVPGNKVNLMIYDGEYFYVHKNEAGTMHMREKEGGVIFSTQALEPVGWKDVEQNRLLVYKEGELVYKGQSHNDTYIHDEKRMEVLFLQYSGL